MPIALAVKDELYLFEGEKNSMGRVVYLSDDALSALKLWIVSQNSRRFPMSVPSKAYEFLPCKTYD